MLLSGTLISIEDCPFSKPYKVYTNCAVLPKECLKQKNPIIRGFFGTGSDASEVSIAGSYY